MGTCFLYGNGGGVSSGSCSTLTVTAPVGCTVTVSKDDKTYTKSAGSSGSATFKGLSSGTWSITISNSSQTATDTIDINVDYAITLAFFSATINVTYPSGSTCTATDGTTTLHAPDTSGTWVCVVPNAGTWTITSTDGSKTSSRDVSITESGQSESATISYIYWAFDEGNSVDYTGGWLSSYSGKPWETYEPSTEIAVETGTGPNSYAYNVVRASDTAIDLTGFSILYITVSNRSTNTGIVGISETDDTHASYVVSTSISSQKTYTIDVSSYTGNYYLRMQSGGGQNGGSGWATFGYRISKLWLE